MSRGSDQPEDWTEIEAMLAAPTPEQEAAALARARRRRAVPLIVSAAVASTAFAGVLTAAFWGVPSSCALRSDGCTGQALQAANPPSAPAPQQATPTNHVADAGAAQPGAAQAPVVQGRSVSESEGTPDAAATIEPTPPEAVPERTRHGRSHRHHRTMQ